MFGAKIEAFLEEFPLGRKRDLSPFEYNSRRTERYLFVPRALPWAELLQAFSLRKNASLA